MLGSELQETGLQRIAHKTGLIVNTQFLHEICAVGVDSAKADKELAGYFFAREALSDQMENLLFSIAEDRPSFGLCALLFLLLHKTAKDDF